MQPNPITVLSLWAPMHLQVLRMWSYDTHEKREECYNTRAPPALTTQKPPAKDGIVPIARRKKPARIVVDVRT